MSDEIQNKTSEEPIKPMVLDYDDVCKMAPFFKGKEKLVNKIFHWISVDKTNDFHQRNMHLSGPDFCHNIFDYVGATLTVRNEHVLENLPEGAFITVSNHPFGSIDGMTLIDIIGHHRPDYKVMVNMILNKIGSSLGKGHHRCHAPCEAGTSAGLLPCRGSVKAHLGHAH